MLRLEWDHLPPDRLVTVSGGASWDAVDDDGRYIAGAGAGASSSSSSSSTGAAGRFELRLTAASRACSGPWMLRRPPLSTAAAAAAALPSAHTSTMTKQVDGGDGGPPEPAVQQLQQQLEEVVVVEEQEPEVAVEEEKGEADPEAPQRGADTALGGHEPPSINSAEWLEAEAEPSAGAGEGEGEGEGEGDLLASAQALLAARMEAAQAAASTAAAAVSHSCACIGSPCLRHCVHGASIGGGGAHAAAARRAAAAGAAVHSAHGRGCGGELHAVYADGRHRNARGRWLPRMNVTLASYSGVGKTADLCQCPVDLPHTDTDT
eukprot:SAG25_NODE_1434_length_3030_cov_2.096213_2_plen_320_part_00